MVNLRWLSWLFGKTEPLNPLQSQSMSCELETTTRSSESIGDSSNSSFLQLSRESIDSIKKPKSHVERLNALQCHSMSCKLETTLRSIENMVDSVDDTTLLSLGLALENFYRVSEKARQLVEDCCRTDWWQASAFQIQNEEAFREILLEAGLSYNTIFQVVDDVHKKKRKELLCEDLRETATFNPSGADEVHKDRVALQERLSGLVEDANFSMRYRWLAQYLLARVTFVIQHSLHEDYDVKSFDQWADGDRPEGEWGAAEHLGGSVYKTAWLDVPCARKVFGDEGYEEEWLAEAKILASLNHPNIVKFLCCNKYRTEHCSGHYIAMEQMETSLATFITRLKESGEKLSLYQALDVIMQIAYGLCYLHDHGVAHRDLKTSNVVVRKVSDPRIQYKLEVKLADFGVSKVKLRAGKSNTITRPKIGTTVYMPPEAFTNGRADWFKADVYSFSVMCSVILSCRDPFQHVKFRDVHRAVCDGQRPELPGDTPKELVDLMMESWATDRKLRPSIHDICLRLEKLRDKLLRFDGTSHHVRQEDSSGSDSYIERMLKRRSETRECDWSYGRVQTLMDSMDEEECLDGDEVQETIVEVQEMAMQEEEQDDSSTKSEEVEYTSPDIAEVDLEASVVYRGIRVLVELTEDYECSEYVRRITAQLLKNLVEVGKSELVAQNERTVRRSLYDGGLPFMTKASITDYKARFASCNTYKQGQSRAVMSHLRKLVDWSAENWTYAILWDCSRDLQKLRWRVGYYKGIRDGKLIEPKHRRTAENQLHRKKVLGELQALVLRPDEEVTEDVSDTEWFYLVSMAHSFGFGEGTPGQAWKSREPVWLSEANKASIEVCTRAHLAKMARIQTIVCVPLHLAVVELGSTDLIPKRPEILERMRDTYASLVFRTMEFYSNH